MLDPSLSANAVEHFREFFRDLTPEKIVAMDAEARDDYAAACWGFFYSFGDPFWWNGFDELSDFAKESLTASFEAWPGHEETQRLVDLSKLSPIPESARPIAPVGVSANLSAWVEYFRRHFKDMGVEEVTLSSGDGEKFLATCRIAFETHGDPKSWDGFDGLPDVTRHVLTECHKNWLAETRTTLEIPKGGLIH